MKLNLRRVRGFTLVELVLVSLLVVMIGVTVFAVFSNGVKIWKRLSISLPEEDIYVFFEKLSADLENSFIFSKAPLTGEGNAIVFATVVRSPGEHNPSSMDIARVSYAFDSADGAILRRQDDFSAITKAKAGDARSVARGIDSVTFTYYYFDQIAQEYEWKENWRTDMFQEEEYTLPIAVRVVVEFGGRKDRRSLTRTVTIPAGG